MNDAHSRSGPDGVATARVLVAGSSNRVMALQRSLATRGFRVETALHKERQRPLPDAGPFDLVVLDLTRPGLDLPELLGRSTALANVEFVVLGDELSFAELSEVLDRRRFLMLGNPCGTDEVIAAIELALLQRQLKSENRELRARLDDVKERGAADRLANFQAHHDLVTRLPNRALLNDRLDTAIARAQRSQRKLAVMFLDLDGFKAVNDSLGHDLGDRLLKAVAERLQGCIRRSDTLARYGGDEFALLLPDVGAREDAELIAGKILGCLDDPFPIAGRRLSVGASVGIALYPEAGDLGEMLIRKADIAMYHVKSRGKNAYRFFSEEMDPANSGHLATDRELHAGLIRGELDVYYRPRVSLLSGRVTTVEAAWRWRHPERGLVGPGDILPAPTGGESIAAVDDFLHRRAFRQAAEWRQGAIHDVAIAVDLAAARLAQTGFVKRFMGNLVAAGLDAAAATVQIEENALMEGVEAVAAELNDLQSRGVRVVASEYGAGFSSLRYLERLPLAGLKLSPSLIRDVEPVELDLPGAVTQPKGTRTEPSRKGHPPEPKGTPTELQGEREGIPTEPEGTPPAPGRRSIAAIAAAAGELRLQLIASGVKSPEQLAFLKSCGFTEADGPVFSRAMPAAEIEKLFIRNPFASLVGL